jgi:hypothetical protein
MLSKATTLALKGACEVDQAMEEVGCLKAATHLTDAKHEPVSYKMKKNDGGEEYTTPFHLFPVLTCLYWCSNTMRTDEEEGGRRPLEKVTKRKKEASKTEETVEESERWWG